MHKLEQACEGNEAMLGYMREIVSFEMRESKQYKSNYEDLLKRYALEEINDRGN